LDARVTQLFFPLQPKWWTVKYFSHNLKHFTNTFFSVKNIFL
jgi:hypothetical protein